MVDAVVGPEVHGNEVDTIDGVEPSSQPAVKPRAAPAAAEAPDYGELVTVERRHYEIGRDIARGGMGRVFEARDRRLGRAVAIKELRPDRRDLGRRFEREARITARLQHPAIIHVYEAGVWPGGDAFYAMTKVKGRSLDKVVAERKTLVERLGLLPNVIAVADALAYAHNENVIHRDLKPANVLVGAFGETVVIDWGLAKDLGAPGDPNAGESMKVPRPDTSLVDETNAGSVVGTVAYMAPEQARDASSVDQRADVYALGALLYHVLVGAAPYVAETHLELIELVKSSPYRPVRERAPGAPPDLIAIVDKAMARDPGDRYANAGELALDLKRFETGQLVAAHHYTRRQLVWRFLQRYRLAVGVSAIAVVALAVVGTVSISRIIEEKRLNERRRNTLLEERGREHLLEGNSGRALAYLVGAAHDGEVGGARGFMLAEALRPFEAELATFPIAGKGRTAVAYSADARRIATIGTSAIDLWDAGGKRERSLGTRRPLGILFDGAGSRIAAIDDDHVVRIFSVAGTLERELAGHTSTILDAAFSADGTRLVTASADTTARVWDLATGRSVVSSCHDKAVIAVRFSPDGENVATVGEDNLVCTWGVHDAHETRLLRSHRQRINSIRWSPDGKYVLTASSDGTARLSYMIDGNADESETARQVGKDAIVPLRHESGLGITSAELSHDGRYVVTTGLDHTAQVWEIPDELVEDVPAQAKLVVKLVGHADAIDHVLFDAEDTVIVTASRDGKARTWNALTGQPIAAFEHADAVTSIALSPDRRRLLTGSQDRTARLWDTTRGVAQATHEVGAVASSVATTGDHTVAVASADSRVTLWRAGVAMKLTDHLGRVYAVAFSPDGTLLASAGEDPTVFVWDVASASRRHVLGPIEKVTRAMAFSPDGELLATASDETSVRLWSTRTGSLVRTLTSASAIVALAYRGDGGLLVGLTVEGTVVAWSPSVPAPTDSRLVMNGLGRAIAFSHDGRRLVVGGKTDARIFAVGETQLGDELLRIDGSTGEVRAVAFTVDGSRVITAGTDGIAKLWDASKGKLVGIRDAHGGAINSIALTADGNTLWTASDDRSVRAWNIRVESRPAGELDVLLERRVPWRLGNDDVVTRKTGGDRDGKHRPNSE